MNEREKKLATEARNAYARAWRAKNPDKVKRNNASYWLRKANRELSAGKKDDSGEGK